MSELLVILIIGALLLSKPNSCLVHLIYLIVGIAIALYVAPILIVGIIILYFIGLLSNR